MEARISHREARPVQSGPARMEQWLVEFAPETPPDTDPLMGWLSSTDANQQLRMAFATQAEAEGYCRRRGLDYVVHPVIHRSPHRSYAENFEPADEGGPKGLYPH
jgi:ETC complex I subunit conserved region